MIEINYFLFFFGLICGSFLNSLIYRIDNNISFSGRSFCPKCKKKITWYDNIPLLSYLILRGKCRNCKKPISKEYPAVELLTASLFLLIGQFSEPGAVVSDWLNRVFNSQFSIYNESITESIQLPTTALISLIFLLTTCFLLLLVAIYDAKTKYVLTYYVYAAAAFAVLYNTTEYFRLNGQFLSSGIVEYFLLFVLAAFIPAGIFWLASKLSKEKIMGSGDADIALAIGFLLGWAKIVPAYYFAFLVGAAWGVCLLVAKKANMKSEMPFGPFLISGAFFSLIFGEQLIVWYGKIFLGY
jgi:leader peptidase (prepilin peptidase) / N-methyltransferase